MSTSPFIEETTFVDDEGQTWTARQTVGMGTAGMGEEIGTLVDFTNNDSGKTLRGRVLGLAAVGIVELRRTLDDAKRRHRAGLPPR